MASDLEISIIALITVVIFYLLLGLILTFTWNRSVTKIFNTGEIHILEAVFLLLTMNILFGTFSHGALTVYNGYNNKSTNNMTQ